MNPLLKIKTFVFFSWPGKAHDARVFNHSPLREKLADLCYALNQHLDETYHILGDSAYPLSNHLMTPYRARLNMSLAQKKFNTNLASKHSVIERAFGLLGQRFPHLLKLKVKSLEKKVMCIVSVCVLHNWCIIENDVEEEDFEEVVSSLDCNVNRFSAKAELGRRRWWKMVETINMRCCVNTSMQKCELIYLSSSCEKHIL